MCHVCLVLSWTDSEILRYISFPVFSYSAKLLTCNHYASRKIKRGLVPFVTVSTAVICLPISFLGACLVGLATKVCGLWPVFTPTYANDRSI